ncbi:MAG: molecular chaperone DnaJ [Sphingomonas bacterium]|uniref:DnaJ domain-containing protein n=1 Tax=Sphingomonas bacterium TaxID=1895847 RepID=UPI00260897C9|nr:DnaJ domain-containing protein [Sphingomonas bacterium]MDB5705216.1 molecular chaperone DnaJ [Sphingomonas bacterium]
MSKLVFIGLLMFGAWLLLRRNPPALTIDEKEARAILGVDTAADAEAIRAAHRRLVSAVHPDRGGSAELARRINAARDVLLKRRN